MAGIIDFEDNDVTDAFIAVSNYIKKRENNISYFEIAEKVDISKSQFYSLRSKKSSSSFSSGVRYLSKMCEFYDISFEFLDNNEVRVYKGFDKNLFITNYVLIFWNTKLENLRLLKIHRYVYSSFNHEIYDFYDNTIFENRGGLSIIINEKLNETYEISSIHWDIYEDTEEIESDFFFGIEGNNNYFGRLFFGVKENQFYKIKDNLDGIEYLLKNQELQQSIPPHSIFTIEELLNFINNYQIKNKNFIIEIPEELVTAYQQFLNFFNEYVRVSKGKEVDFNVFTKDRKVEINIKTQSKLEYDEIIRYLEEYIGFTKQNINNLKIEIERDISENEFNFLILDLKQQLSHLKNSLEVASFKNKLLSDDLSYFKNLVMEMTKSKQLNSSEHSKSKNNSFRQKLLKLFSENKDIECLNNLISYFNNDNNKQGIKESILLKSKLNQLKEEKRHGVIDANLFLQKSSEIKSAILEIIDNEDIQ